MADHIQAHQGSWDPAQFKLQPDGTFRISIRGMAAMAGVDHRGLNRSLKSAGDENALPCARSLALQGFNPGDVSSWSETGGIPEAAAPFILEHYAFTASSPSAQARAVLLAFSRVGINAYLKERLGVSQVRDTQPVLPAPVEQVKAAAEALVYIWDALEARGLADDRDRIELKRDLKVLNTALVHATAGRLPGTSNVLSPVDRLPRFLGRAVDIDAPLTLVEWAAAYLPGEISRAVNKHDCQLGRAMAKLYRERHDEEPQTTTHLSVKAEEGRRRLNLPMFGAARNGNAVTPKIYLPRDWDLFVAAMRHKGVIAPDKAAELLAECQQFRVGMDF